MYTTLERAREHLNILPGECEEDNSYILHLIISAEHATAKRLNLKSLGDLINPDTGYIPEDITHAVLLLVGSWYNARETFSNQSASPLPHSYDFIASLNKNYKSTF